MGEDVTELRASLPQLLLTFLIFQFAVIQPSRRMLPHAKDDLLNTNNYGSS